MLLSCCLMLDFLCCFRMVWCLIFYAAFMLSDAWYYMLLSYCMMPDFFMLLSCLMMVFCQGTLEPVEKALRDAKMDKSSIHDIVLVGGSTRYLNKNIYFTHVEHMNLIAPFSFCFSPFSFKISINMWLLALYVFSLFSFQNFWKM